MKRKRNPATVDPRIIRDFIYQRDMLLEESVAGGDLSSRRNAFLREAVRLANETARADVARRARNWSRR